MIQCRFRAALAPASLLLTAALIAGCGKKEEAAPAAAAPAPGAAWGSYRDEFIESYFKAHPTFAVNAGRHEFDGKLPDLSAAALHAEVARLHAERDRAAAFGDSQLDDAQRFER